MQGFSSLSSRSSRKCGSSKGGDAIGMFNRSLRRNRNDGRARGPEGGKEGRLYREVSQRPPHKYSEVGYTGVVRVLIFSSRFQKNIV